MVMGVVGRVVGGDEAAGGRKNGVDVTGADELGLDAVARHDVAILVKIEGGLTGDAKFEFAAIRSDGDSFAGCTGAGGKGERRHFAGALEGDDETCGAVGFDLKSERAAGRIAQHGGFRGVGGELQDDHLPGAVELRGGEDDAVVFGCGDRAEKGESDERGEERAGGGAHRNAS